MPTVAQTIAQTLAEAKIDTVFGLPGGENTELMDALRHVDLRFVLVRSESSAIFMADVAARLTGRTGVALTTLGPGVANAYAGIAHAWLDRAPVLVITAQTPARLIGSHTHQVLDTQAILAPVSKHSAEITPATVRQQVIEALRLTMTGRPGLVHLGLSSETAPLVTTAEFVDQAAPHTPQTITDIAQNLLVRARRPVLVVGLGLEPERPYAALQKLAEALQSPVIVTPKAKGALPDDHPLSAGVIGLTRNDPVYEILDEADVVIAVGFDVVELVKPWQQVESLIWIAPWENVDPSITARAELVGKVEPTLQALSQTITHPDPAWGAARVEALQQKLAGTRFSLSVSTTMQSAPKTMLPQTVLAILRDNTPGDIFVATDVGSHKILAALTWPSYAPNRYMLSNGLSSMGFGLPAAAAASLILGEPTLCITGDAGLAMAMGELGMIAELNLPVIVVVMNDQALDLIRSHQQRSGKQPYGVEFRNPDFQLIARAHGIDAYRVNDENSCAAAILAALAIGKPALIEAIIDPSSYPTTPN